jgi:hypothetical protein
MNNYLLQNTKQQNLSTQQEDKSTNCLTKYHNQKTQNFKCSKQIHLGTLQWYQSEDSSQPEGLHEGKMAIVEEIIYCDMEYQALSETFRAQVTFQQFVSIKNPRWSKDDIAVWAKKIAEVNYWRRKVEESRAKTVRKVDTSPHASGLKGAQIEPTTIRSRELCYSCKKPWEPDHRCRGKGRVHYIEVHYDSDDEDVYEDAGLRCLIRAVP